MTSYVIEGVVVYDSVLYERGHMIRRWAEALERRFTRNAIEEAPLNKRVNKTAGEPPVGTLKAGISGEVTRVGVRHLETKISSSAPYSLHVLKGTGPIITARSSRGMTLPANLGFAAGRARTVRGQSANNFLGRAHNETARFHPSLRPFPGVEFSRGTSI